MSQIQAPLKRSLSAFEARSMPVDASGQDLPPVALERLHPAAIRERLRSLSPDWVPELRGDSSVAPGSQPRADASVLLGLVPRDEGLKVLLTRRTDHLRHHAGQISFPGGRREPSDADAVAAALREVHEEIGVPPSAVDVLGQLPRYTTVTGFAVTPVVGLIDRSARFEPDPGEVAEVFEVPLSFLMTPAHHWRHRVDLGAGASRHFWSMPWSPESGEVHRVDEAPYFIWGATAAMLRNFYQLLSD